MPLALVGHFLNYVGNHLLSYVHQTMGRKIFYPKSKALQINLLPSGHVVTKVLKTEVAVIYDSEGRLQIIEQRHQFINFKSKAVIVANGAVQAIHPDFDSWFPNQAHKCIGSDQFLKQPTFTEHLSKLKPAARIVIIGGSHSGFSCAWMLLN